MKLFSRYNRILIVVSFAGLVLIGVLFYNTLTHYLNIQLDDQLEEELMEVQDYTHAKNIIPDPYYFDDLVIQYKPVQVFSKEKSVEDTVFYNDKKKQSEAGRYLKTIINFNGKPYQVLIITSKLKSEEQIKSIFLVIIVPVIFLFLALFVVNRLVIKKLWGPFNTLLANIKTFNINQEAPYSQVNTTIVEFRELNAAITEMSSKIKSDYNEIKLFTENASHEMMTPLAVINSKLDTILQSKALGEAETDILADLYKATSRLTKLNQSLLLLVKIDNNQISDEEHINVAALIEEKLAYFRELISSRELDVRTSLFPLRLITSRYLFEILMNNLFTNAIRHNIKGGAVKISLTNNSISFSNTGDTQKLDDQRIFERFYKDSTSEGTGLGLSILRQICLKMNYDLEYDFDQNMHRFTIIFHKNSEG